MNQQKVEKLIKNWHKKSVDEIDVFSKFAFLWFCFNAWIAYKTRKSRDDEMLKDLISGKIPDMKKAYDKSRMDIDQFLNELIQEGSIRDDRLKPKPPILINNKDDFRNIVGAIYRIRCNLFHGRKDGEEPRNEKLIRLAGNILNVWIVKLINSWCIREKIEITKNIIEKIAEQKGVINYGILYQQIGLDVNNIADRNMGCDILEQVNDITLCENNIMLSSVVTSKEKNEPYDGYYKYASIKGKLKNELKVDFWIAELKKCHDFYGQK